MSGPIDEQLNNRAWPEHNGDAGTPPSAAIGTIYQKHFRKLVRDLIAAFGLGPPDPEDIAQRTFEQLLKRGTVENIASLEAFLWRAAKNHRLSQLRSMASIARRDTVLETIFLSNPGYLECPERVLESKERIGLTLQALKAMPSDRRRAFEMVRFDGLAHKEVAQIMGISRPAVSKHVAKAMRDISLSLEAAGATDD